MIAVYVKKVGSGRAIKTLLVIAGIALAYGSHASAATILPVSIAANPTNFVEGTAGTITANFTDDTPTNGNYTAIFQWADSSITTNHPTGNGTNVTATAPHTYQYATNVTVIVSLVNTDTLASATNSLALVVADAPLGTNSVVSGGPSSGTEGVFSNQTLLTFSDNPLATTNDYNVAVTWGAAVSNTTPVIVANGGGQFSVQSDFAYYDEGTNTIQVTVTDLHGGQVVSNSTTIIVGDAPLAIVSTNKLVFTEGIVSNATLLTFNDGNVLVNKDPSDFTALINWGDGSAIDTNPVTYVTNNTQFAVSGSHMYAEESTNNFVTVTVIDEGGSTITVSGDSAAVVDALLTVVSVDLTTPVTGFDPLSAQGAMDPRGADLITFSDANTVSYQHPPYQEYKAIIQWGDGTSSIGTVTNISGNTYVVYGDHIYNSTCTNFTVTVQVNDVGSALATSSVAKSFTLYVQDAAFHDYGPLTIHSKNNAVFNGIVAAFSYLDTTLGASSFTATINWGDNTGTDTNATIVANGNGTYLVLGSHTYQAVNGTYQTYNLTVTVNDSNVCSTPHQITDTTVSTFTGLDVEMNPTNMYVVTGVSFTLPVATFTDSALPAGMLSNLTAVIIWDTAIPSEGTSVGDITRNPDGTYLVTGTHTYQENGSHCVSVKVIDALENMSDSGECSYFISAAPVVNPNLGTTYVTTGTSFNEKVATINGSVLPAGLLARINWGDSAAGVTPDTYSDGVISSGGIITGTHTYYLDGTYQVSVTLYDASGNLLTNTFGSSQFYASASVRDVTSSMAVVFGQTTMKKYKTSGSSGKGKGPSFTTYYIQKVTILNISGATVTGPFGLVLNTDDLKNLTGIMEDGRQYIPLSQFSLRAKQKTTVTLIYQHIPTIQPVSVLAGPGM